MRYEKPVPEYVDRLIHDWRLDEQSGRFQTRVRSVLTELSGEALLCLVDPRLEVMARPEEGYSVWAHFPIYERRWIAQKLKPKSATRVLLVFSAEIFEKQPAGQSEDELRDHLGHVLLYLRKPSAKNECADALTEWRASTREPRRAARKAKPQNTVMSSDSARRRSVRKYLLTGEQPQDGPVLITRPHSQRTFVIAKDSAGRVLWAFWTASNRLYGIDGAYLIALENEEMKAKA